VRVRGSVRDRALSEPGGGKGVARLSKTPHQYPEGRLGTNAREPPDLNPDPNPNPSSQPPRKPLILTLNHNHNPDLTVPVPV